MPCLNLVHPFVASCTRYVWLLSQCRNNLDASQPDLVMSGTITPDLLRPAIPITWFLLIPNDRRPRLEHRAHDSNTASTLTKLKAGAACVDLDARNPNPHQPARDEMYNLVAEQSFWYVGKQ